MIRRRHDPRAISLLVPLLAACSGGRAQEAADASVDVSAPTPVAAVVAAGRPPIDHARALAPLARHFDPELHLARVGSGYQLDGYVPSGRRGLGRFTLASAERMVATIPARSSDAVHVGVRGDDGRERHWIDVVAEDLAAAPARAPEVRAGATAYRDAVPGQDLVQLLEPGRVEELRVVRAPADRLVTGHRVRASASIKTIRAVGEVVEVLDREGRVVIASEPIVAYDASGGPVATHVSVEHDADGWRLETSVDTRARAFPITLDPSWIIQTTSVPNAHAVAWMFPQPNSKVALLGGSSVDVFDPYGGSSGSWTSLTAMKPWYHTTPILLADGRFLLATSSPYYWPGGGANVSTLTFTYDPTTGASTRVGDVPNVHDDPRMVRLADGRVVAYGASEGYSNANGAVEVFDPVGNTWSTAFVTPYTIGKFTMTLLNDGRVYVGAGGAYGTGAQQTVGLLFDMSANTYRVTAGSMAQTRADHVAAKLGDGTVLMIGGDYGGTGNPNASTAELYNPVTDSFTLLPAKLANDRRNGHSVTNLPDGRLMIIGGQGGPSGSGQNAPLSTTELYDPVAKTFTLGPTMNYPHYLHDVAPLPGGRYLVAGGFIASGTTTQNAEIYMPDPIPATTGAGCATGFASDGYCCDRACTGTCEACNLPGRIGVCSPVAGVPPSGHGSCAPFVCAGASATTGKGICATSCATDAGCASGDYCDAGTSLCAPQKAQASGCARSAECAGGNCVDGVCCDGACNTSACVACDVAGSVGTCTNVASGDPHGTHGTCGVYACAAGACASGTCTADTQCASHRFCSGGSCGTAAGQGATCARDAQCQSGHCVDGYCCDGACGSACQACDLPSKLGTCTTVNSGAPHGTRSCGAYATCSAGACSSTCAIDTDCTTGNGCSATKCIVRKSNGAACTASTDCASGSCADGVCCNSACNGACQACNLTATIGTCTAVDGFADPHALCATGPCATGVCKAGACGFKSSGAACGSSACASGVLTASACDGATASCPAATTAPCAGSLACASTTTCKSACVVDADCTSGVCDATGKCVAPVADAGPDTAMPDTADTAMPDTADTAMPDTADTALPDTADTALPDTADTALPDTADTALADTASAEDTRPIAEVGAPKLAATPTVAGFQRCHADAECGSGHCVEGVCCDTECKEACHSCALLTSPGKCTLEPIGVDLKNDCGPGLQCLGTCGAAGECIGSGPGTQCARNRCTGPSVGVGPAYCPGPGETCDTDGQVPFDCGPYACEPAFGACLTTCSTTDECAPGNICDPTTTHCGPVPTPAASNSGCALGAPGTEGAGNSAALLGGGLAVAALAFARRRRAR